MNRQEKEKMQATLPYAPPIVNIATVYGGALANSPDFSAAGAAGGFHHNLLINMTGSRQGDRTLLYDIVDAIGGIPLNNCHCHHVYTAALPQCNVQWVNAANHIATYPHAGAVKQWNDVGGPRYRVVNSSNTVQAESVTSPIKYTQEDIALFEEKYGVKLPDFIKTVYLERSSAQTEYLDKEKNSYFINEIIPLLPLDGYADAGFIIEVLNGKLPVPCSDNLAYYPFASDCCGNIFYCRENTIIFYDHEEHALINLV